MRRDHGLFVCFVFVSPVAHLDCMRFGIFETKRTRGPVIIYLGGWGDFFCFRMKEKT